VISHRGLSGRLRRTKMITIARTGPTRNDTRQPTLGASAFSRTKDANVPMIDPAQYVPLIQISVRPRYRAGIISSIAELIAEYSPPIPDPAMNRVR
jgi:hypothetical protein